MNESAFLGTGWSFPPAFDKANNSLQLTAGDSNISQSIDVVLQTKVGSRSLLPTYGCDLFQYVFRRIDATARAEIVQSVKQTLLDCEPRITVEEVGFATTADGASVALNIRYWIKQTNTRHNHVFPFSLIEGTNLHAGFRAIT